MKELFTVKQASLWAKKHLNKNVSSSNITYLIQYGKIPKYNNNGTTAVNKYDLIDYYQNLYQQREYQWKEKLGSDLNWALSFDTLKEKETTKHVHRLHPYKGKFIPQLVEYFIDEHTDQFKTQSYFKAGDIILDPFAGSGTALIQANELGMHAVGIDISAFNALIANIKVHKVNFNDLCLEIERITSALQTFISEHNNHLFEYELLEALNRFNKQFFPAPEFKVKLRKGEIVERAYTPAKEQQFAKIFDALQKKYKMNIYQKGGKNFLDKWYLEPVKKEIYFVFEQLKKIKNPSTKKVMISILSRTIRSCRATTHADLATLKEPISKTYYCRKHGKICKPLFSIFSWWKRYSADAIRRFYEFDKLRTDTYQECLAGDARNINIYSALSAKNPPFAALFKKQKIKGIFSSPPYVGLIDYHEQHAYAYDLFKFKRNDNLEIGSLFKGQGIQARKSYIDGIVRVLKNSKSYMQDDYDVFLVANDKYDMYPMIAEQSGMKIVNRYKRPVLNRTEKDKSAYAETIFHLQMD